MSGAPAGVVSLPAFCEPLAFRDLECGRLVVVRYGRRGSQIALVKAVAFRPSATSWCKAWKYSRTKRRWTRNPVRVSEFELLGAYAPGGRFTDTRQLIATMHADAAACWEACGKAVQP